MAITISDFTARLVSIPVNGKSVPIIAIYADFTGIDTNTDHQFIVPADVYNAVRSMWATLPLGITLQRRGTALNALTDVVEVNETNTDGVRVQGLFTAAAHEYYNISYYVESGGAYKQVFWTTPSYYLGSNNRQRIATGLLFVDKVTGKAVPYNTTSPNGHGDNLVSETIPAPATNPNPNGATTYNGFPICIAPITWVRTTTQQTTITAQAPYLVELKGITPYESVDPYEPGGESEPGGGTGTFDGTGDDIDFPSLPTLSATDTGFITLFNPSAGELRALANYMWSTGFDLDTFKKLFADPMDAILGMSIVPVAVPNGGSRAVTVGNISTGVNMNVAASQYVEIDCGTLNVEEYWGAYLDYDPYTKAEIYLPYIGTHPVAVDDIMNKPVHVKYHVDVLSGACCAYVKCGGSVLYSFVGQCSCSIPITGNDWSNVVNGALSIAASIGTMVATGGATAPMAAATVASTAVNSMKPNVEKSGSLGGMGGMLGVQTPYLILTRPRQALPKGQNHYSGYPSFITKKLEDVSGYTEIDSIHIENVGATELEINEIETLLKGGVIL